MPNKCWICEKNDANSGEHAILKCVYEKILGKPSKDEQRYFSYVGGKKNIPIGSFKNDRLKFEKNMCSHCNNTLTQPYDYAFKDFVDKLFSSKSVVITRNKISFSGLDQNNLSLYFIKIFGCLLAEQRGSIKSRDFQLFRRSLLNGKTMTDNMFLTIHRDLAKLNAKGTPTISNHPVLEKRFSSWIIDLDWISLIISYPFAPVQKKYGDQWLLGSNIASLRIGKLT